MGASQSSQDGNCGGGAGRTGNGRPMTHDGIDTQDYYGLLQLPEPSEASSTSDEIRKAYRRLALRYHPDKNPDDVEAANERFRLIQAAYEVLSDDQERAWYDAHREQILHGPGEDGYGDDDEEFDEETFQNVRTGKQRAPPAPTGSSLPGLTPRHVMRFMDASLCMDVTPPSSDEAGFYGTYRRIFERLADEEKGAAAYPGEAHTSPYEALPGFGYSHTPYMHGKGVAESEQTVHQTQVRDFYAAWGAFATRKGFAWRDGHRLHDAPDRRVKRAMEKANKQMRDAARREYNDTVRSLVSFVKKRDPRVKAHLTAAAQATMAAASPEEMQRRKEAAEREKRVQEEQARAAYKKQSWDAWEQGAAVASDASEEEDSEASFGEVVQGSDQGEGGEDDGEREVHDEQGESLECFVCDKVFQSEAAFSNHERSNKHKKEVQKVRREMLKEDRKLRKGMKEMGIEEEDVPTNSALHDDDEQPDTTVDQPEDDDATAGLSKKARQKLKKRLKEQEKAAASASASATPTAPPSSDEEAKGRDDANGHSGATAEAEADESAANGKKSRRARKNGGGKAAKERCNVCSTGFDSRSKLFAHIRDTGHALAPPAATPSGKQRS